MPSIYTTGGRIVRYPPMKIFGRQDLLLVAALTTALVIVFSSSISRGLDYAREIERQSGLTLMPALVLLTAAFFFHQYRRNHQQQATAQAAELATGRNARESSSGWWHSVRRWAAPWSSRAIRVAVSQHLPAIAGTTRCGCSSSKDPNGSRSPAIRAARKMSCRGASSRNSCSRARRQAARMARLETPRDPERAIGFPLLAGGSAMGVLGVRPSGGALPADRRRIIEAAAALLAVSVKNAQLFRELKDNSVKDALTGCFTRSHSLDVIDAELRRARRSQTPVSLIMFDLDHFKDVTDRHGHLCSEAVLSAVGTRMKEVLRGSDLKCRYGGERFLVLLPETPLHGARRVAETLRREIAERPVPWSGEGLTITASFGLAQTMPGEVNAQAVIARADQALYRAKDDGRNCVRIAAETATLVADETHRHNRVD